MTEAEWKACESFWAADPIDLGVSFRKFFHAMVSALPALADGTMCTSCREGLGLVEVVADDELNPPGRQPEDWPSAKAVHNFLYKNEARKRVDRACRAHNSTGFLCDQASGYGSLADTLDLMEKAWGEANGIKFGRKPRRQRDRSHEAYRGPGPRAALAFVRDVIGNTTFQPIEFDHTSLPALAVSLAQAAYNERQPGTTTLENDRLVVLADALEEAGGVPPAIIEHLRSPGPHIRGCWSLDLLLGHEIEEEEDEDEEEDEPPSRRGEFDDDFI
jgi:hypothetical protein